MMEIFEYLKARYVSEKAQGMIEYALIAAFICAVAAVVFSSKNGPLYNAVTTAFGAVSNKAATAANP